MTTKSLKIGILETGRLPDDIAQVHGDYPALFRQWLAPLGTNFQTFAAIDGVLPDGPKACDLWVITGSRHGAYEDHSWIPPLENFIRASRDYGQKMVGICFGHQIIAQALGGVVEKSAKGWGLGVHDYKTRNWPGVTPELKLQAYHQDQVVRAPDSATNIATSDFCEHAALWYPGFALTVQGHPEMSAGFVSDLLASSRGVKLGPELVRHARETVGNNTTRAALAIYLRDNIAAI